MSRNDNGRSMGKTDPRKPDNDRNTWNVVVPTTRLPRNGRARAQYNLGECVNWSGLGHINIRAPLKRHGRDQYNDRTPHSTRAAYRNIHPKSFVNPPRVSLNITTMNNSAIAAKPNRRMYSRVLMLNGLPLADSMTLMRI